MKTYCQWERFFLIGMVCAVFFSRFICQKTVTLNRVQALVKTHPQKLYRNVSTICKLQFKQRIHGQASGRQADKAETV